MSLARLGVIGITTSLIMSAMLGSQFVGNRPLTAAEQGEAIGRAVVVFASYGLDRARDRALRAGTK